MNPDSKYKFEIWTRDSQLIADLSGLARNRSFKLTRNRGYEASFSLDIFEFEKFCNDSGVLADSVLGIGQNELRIKRNNRYVFGGQIVHYETDFTDNTGNISVRAVGFLELFDSRYLDAEKTYTSTDAGEIAMDLIDDTQALTNGDFGVVTDSAFITASVDRDRTYPIYKNIKEAIIELSDVINGFDFEFTYDKKFYVYYPMGVQRTEFIFEYPGNIKKIKIATDATKLLNYAIVRGQNVDEVQPVEIEEDLDSEAAYALRMGILDEGSTSLSATLSEKGQEAIRINKDPYSTLDITMDGNQEPFLGAYWLGDTILVKVTGFSLYEDINNYYKIDEINAKISDEDSEDITLKISTV